MPGRVQMAGLAWASRRPAGHPPEAAGKEGAPRHRPAGPGHDPLRRRLQPVGALTQRYGPLPVLLRAQAVAIAVVLPFGAWGARLEWDWGGGAMLVLACSGAASPSWPPPPWAPGRTGTRSVPIYFLPWWPCAGALARHEEVSAVSASGVALVVAGAWLASRRRLNARRPSPPRPCPPGHSRLGLPPRRCCSGRTRCAAARRPPPPRGAPSPPRRSSRRSRC